MANDTVNPAAATVRTLVDLTGSSLFRFSPENER